MCVWSATGGEMLKMGDDGGVGQAVYVWFAAGVTRPRRGQTSAVRVVSAVSVSPGLTPKRDPPRISSCRSAKGKKGGRVNSAPVET